MSCLPSPTCQSRSLHDGSHSSNKTKEKAADDAFTRTFSAGSTSNADSKFLPGSPDPSCCKEEGDNLELSIVRMNSKVNVHHPHSPKSKYLQDVRDEDFD
jgi:hypothetical protein